MLSMSEQEDEIRGGCVVLGRGRRVIGNSEDTVLAILGVLPHMRRILELRLLLVGHPVMPAAPEQVATLTLAAENRVRRMRLLVSLANLEGNEATMKVATLDKA